ncbi:MAG: alpha/beta fold hydrolase, partial [Planctomycetaceae bacterium]
MDMPETRYARTDDGVSIAYSLAGDGPVDLLWLGAFMGSLEVVWEYEGMRSLTERLCSFARVMRHDMRATGLSGRAAALPDLETQVQDVLAVLDAAGSRSTVIVGAGPGAHLALMFGATFPARTRALCLYDLSAWVGEVFQGRDLDTLTRTWGTEAAASAAMAAVAPSLLGDRDFLRWYARMQRHFLPPDAAAELVRIARATDIRPVLSAVHVPTLVLAREWPGHELDEEIATQIEGARFQLLPGQERASFAGDQDSLCSAIRDFLGLEPARPAAQT